MEYKREMEIQNETAVLRALCVLCVLCCVLCLLILSVLRINFIVSVCMMVSTISIDPSIADDGLSSSREPIISVATISTTVSTTVTRGLSSTVSIFTETTRPHLDLS